MHSFPNNISKDDVNLLSLGHYTGEIELIENEQDEAVALEDINQSIYVGFDTESKPAFKKGTYNPIALIQIATVKKTYLFRINKYGLSEEMKTLLGNEKVGKIGIGLNEDLRDLSKLGVEKISGFIHLNEIVKEIDIESNGLRKLTAIILGFRVSKSAQVSNWEARKLSRKQILYAATDAWVCLEMYQKLIDLNLIKHSE